MIKVSKTETEWQKDIVGQDFYFLGASKQSRERASEKNGPEIRYCTPGYAFVTHRPILRGS